MTGKKPWHDAPACPCCGLRVVVPYSSHPPHKLRPYRVAWLRCAACGHDWDEHDATVIAQAWWSQGAEDGRRQAERDRLDGDDHG